MKTTETTVRFNHPFRIGELDEVLPPGEYIVEEDQEELPDTSVSAYRRIRTIFQIPRSTSKRGEARSMTILPAHLIEALARDRAFSEAERALSSEQSAAHDETHSSDLSSTDRDAMIEYGIGYKPTGIFMVDGYRYGRLHDAIAQAKRTAANA
ncbi:MAG: hypothetical protein RIC16_00160 [Rhodospirillales bacterium]